jgi:hypothetical protein
MLVIYSHWVQVVTAKTTRSYITSIIEGRDDIADLIEISQTPWFNFINVQGQQRILLAALEDIDLQSSTKHVGMPLIDSTTQHLKSRKRAIASSGEDYKRRKVE